MTLITSLSIVQMRQELDKTHLHYSPLTALALLSLSSQLHILKFHFTSCQIKSTYCGKKPNRQVSLFQSPNLSQLTLWKLRSGRLRFDIQHLAKWREQAEQFSGQNVKFYVIPFASLAAWSELDPKSPLGIAPSLTTVPKVHLNVKCLIFPS